MRRLAVFDVFGGVQPDGGEDQKAPRAGLTRNVISGYQGSTIKARNGSATTNLPTLAPSAQQLIAFTGADYDGKVFVAQTKADNTIRALGVCEPRDANDDIDADGHRLDLISEQTFATDYDIKRIPNFEDRMFFPVPDRKPEEFLHREGVRRYCGIQAPTSAPSVKVENITNYLVAKIKIWKPENPESSVYDIHIQQDYESGMPVWDYEATSVAWDTDENTTTRALYDALDATLDGNEKFSIYFRQNTIWIYATPDNTILVHTWGTDEDSIVLDSRFRAWPTGVTATFANSTTENFTVSAEGSLTENTYAVIEDELIWVKTLSSDGSNTGTASRGLSGTTAAAHTDASISSVDRFPIERMEYWGLREDKSYYKAELRFQDSMAENEFISFTINPGRYDEINVNYKVTSEASGDGEAICLAVYNIISNHPLQSDAAGFSICTYKVTRDENVMTIESIDLDNSPAVPFEFQNFVGVKVDSEYLRTENLSTQLQADHQYEVHYEIFLRGNVTVTPRLGGVFGTPLQGIAGQYGYTYIVTGQTITMPSEIDDDDQAFEMDIDAPGTSTEEVRLERVFVFDVTESDESAFVSNGDFVAGQGEGASFLPTGWDVEQDSHASYADQWFFPVNGNNVLGQKIAILAQTDTWSGSRDLYLIQNDLNLLADAQYKVRLFLFALPVQSMITIAMDGSSDVYYLKNKDQEQENSETGRWHEFTFTMDTLASLPIDGDRRLIIQGYNGNEDETITIGFISMWDVTNNIIDDWEFDDPGKWVFGGDWRWLKELEPREESFATIGNPVEFAILSRATGIEKGQKVRFAYQYYSSNRRTWSELSPWTSLYEVSDLHPKVNGFEYPRNYQDDISALWLYAAYEGASGFSDIETMAIDMTECDRAVQWTGIGAFFKFTLPEDLLALGTPMPPVGVHEIPPSVSTVEPCGFRMALAGQRGYVSKGTVTAKVTNHNTHRIDADNANIEKAQLTLLSETVDYSMLWMDAYVDDDFVGQVIDMEQDGSDAVYYLSQKYQGVKYITAASRTVEFYGYPKRVWFTGFDIEQSALYTQSVRAENVHPLHYIDLPDDVRDMRYSGGLLFVFMEHGVATISNINILGTPSNLSMRALENSVGEVQPRASVLVPDRGVLFVTENGLMQASTAGVTSIAPHVRRLFSDPDYMDQSTLSSVVGCVARTKDHNLVVLGGYTRGDHGATNEAWLCVNIDTGEVFEHDNIEITSNLLGSESGINPPVAGDSGGRVFSLLKRNTEKDGSSGFTCRWQSDIINFKAERFGSYCRLSLNKRVDQTLQLYVRLGNGLNAPVPASYAALEGEDAGPDGWRDWEYIEIPENTDHVDFAIPAGRGQQMIVELRWNSAAGPYEINYVEIIGG